MANEIKAMLELIVPRFVKTIMEKMNISEKEALTIMYSSKLYEQLDKDETKLWHLSVPTLFEMFREERETGQITYPEEA
jgi:hypothetical protein